MFSFYGASIIGKSHLSNKKPNQDYYLIKNRKKFSFSIMCDGLGSKKHSHKGSKLLSRIFSAFSFFLNSKLIRIKFVIRVVTFFWKFFTFLYGSSHFDTTCQFIFIHSSSLIIGQLGDGLITVTKNGQLSFFESNQDHFINETTSINRSNFNNWRINFVELQPNDVVALSMMTDGISNDLNRQNYSKFLDFILNNLGRFHVSKDRNNYINDLLLQLPNKNNKDDKSFVIGIST